MWLPDGTGAAGVLPICPGNYKSRRKNHGGKNFFTIFCVNSLGLRVFTVGVEKIVVDILSSV